MTTKPNVTPARKRASNDLEIDVLAKATRLLAPLDQAAKERVVHYLANWTRSKGEEVAPAAE